MIELIALLTTISDALLAALAVLAPIGVGATWLGGIWTWVLSLFGGA